MSVITAAKFDAKKLSVSEIKKLDNGSSQVYINYDGKRLRVQAPRMSVPYDAGDYQGNEKFKVQFSFKGKDSNPKMQAYYNMIEAIDNFIIDQATKNAQKWFKMPNGTSRETIALFYSPSIKFSKDKEGNLRTEYPPTQSVALKKRNGAFDTELYDAKGEAMEGVTPVEVLRRNAEVLPINDATGIWVADKKFGLTWKLHQARIDVPGDGGAAKGFMGADDDEDSTVVVAKTGAGAVDDDDVLAAVMPTAAPAEESDDEDDDEIEEHEKVEPVPVPAPVKKAPAPTPAPAATTTVKKVSTVKKVTKTT